LAAVDVVLVAGGGFPVHTLLAVILLSAAPQAFDIGKLLYPVVAIEFEKDGTIIVNGKHVTCAKLRAINPAAFRGVGSNPPTLTEDCHLNPLLNPMLPH
jgi:hypothetical protein